MSVTFVIFVRCGDTCRRKVAIGGSEQIQWENQRGKSLVQWRLQLTLTLPGPDQAAGDPEDNYRDPGQEDHGPGGLHRLPAQQGHRGGSGGAAEGYQEH